MIAKNRSGISKDMSGILKNRGEKRPIWDQTKNFDHPPPPADATSPSEGHIGGNFRGPLKGTECTLMDTWEDIYGRAEWFEEEN